MYGSINSTKNLYNMEDKKKKKKLTQKQIFIKVKAKNSINNKSRIKNKKQKK